jgi:hypothetical protein
MECADDQEKEGNLNEEISTEPSVEIETSSTEK